MTSYKKLKKPLAPQACPIYIAVTGSLAQLVERFVYTEDVRSSSLLSPTIFSKLKNNLKYNYFRFVDKIKTAQSIINPPSIS